LWRLGKRCRHCVTQEHGVFPFLTTERQGRKGRRRKGKREEDKCASCQPIPWYKKSPPEVSWLVACLLEGRFMVDCLLEGFRAFVSNPLNFSQSNLFLLAIWTNNFLTQQICDYINFSLLEKKKYNSLLLYHGIGWQLALKNF
jgi:hypothetical protein